MRCKNCDYALWNLRARTCPECGTPFKPSDFAFVANSVRFCCPHCGQDYYGTGEKGHLVPSEFVCVKCASPVTMDEMVLLPTSGLKEERTRGPADIVPWVDPSRRFFGRWLGTIWMVISWPGGFARALTLTGEPQAWPALWFGVLSLTVFALVGWAIALVPILFTAPSGGARVGVGLFLLIGIPLCSAGALLVWSAVAHLILRVTGKRAGGFPRTLACLSYATSANIFAATPCLGLHLSVVSWIWWVIAGTVMLAAAQRVSGLRATLAVAVLPVAGIVISVLWITAAVMTGIASISTLATQSAAGSIARDTANVSAVTAGLRAYAAANGGAPPPHAMAVVAGNQVSLSNLYRDGVPTRPGEGLVAGMDITSVIAMGPGEQAAAVQRMAKSLGPSPVAHRLGDMVFTYHGIDLSAGSTADPGLWLVVHAPLDEPRAATGTTPNPSAPTSSAPGSTTVGPPAAPKVVVVGTLENGIKVIPIDKWPQELAAQNALRAAAGLPPLPDAGTVQQ